jgi:hypothetical protein
MDRLPGIIENMYVARTTVEFCRPRSQVYEVLTDLSRYPAWNQDMIEISHAGPMQVGLTYDTKSRVAGRINAAHVEVMNLVPDEAIELRSKAGIIQFGAEFRLDDAAGGGTNVTCALSFKFRNFIMDLARPAIEGMARDRVRHDLETLAALLCADVASPGH